MRHLVGEPTGIFMRIIDDKGPDEWDEKTGLVMEEELIQIYRITD